MDEPLDWYLPLYRKPRYPFDNTLKPFLIFHFTEMPSTASDKFYVEKKRRDKHPPTKVLLRRYDRPVSYDEFISEGRRKLPEL